jgi:site-specific DNA-methyltransferase (adenine-specific)
MKTVKLATFIENPDNPYKATEADLARLKGKLERVPKGLRCMRLGYVTDHVARDGTSYKGQRVVISGNKRLRELKIIYGDAASVPAEWFCDCTDMTPEERREFIVSANTVDGIPDAEKLLEQYDRDELAKLMGDKALEEILKAADKDEPKDGKTDADAVPDAPEKPVSRRGEIYQLGNHRLMCGDATSREDMDALMRGECAAFVFTDPPYGVAIGDKNAIINQVIPGKMGRIEENIKGDTLSTDALHDMLVKAFVNTREHCAPDASYYVSSPQGGELGLMMMMMKDAGLTVRHMLVWVKSVATFSLGRLDYDYRHEPIFYTWTKSHDFHGDYSNTVIDDTKPLEKMSKAELKELVHALQQKGETSVIYCDKPTKSSLHPTMKPVALVARFMRNSSHRGGCVLDPFGGSGTTLIACEQLERNCRMMELDAHYCDVIRRRWAEFVHGEGCDWKALTPRAANVPRKEGK